MLTELEFNAINKCFFSLIFCFFLFPASLVLYIFFGYYDIVIITAELLLTLICIYSFTKRTILFCKHPNLITKKRFLFETISYVCCYIIAALMALDIKYINSNNASEIRYGDFNNNLQFVVIIYSIVTACFMAATNVRLKKKYAAYKKEHKIL